MFSFGSDPEFFIVKDNKPVSAIGIVHGTIEHRIEKKDHQFYCDNVLAECAIKPGKSKSEVLQNFRECFRLYADLVKPYRLKPQASYEFKNEQLTHPEARMVGCAPDMCAYEVKQKLPPIIRIKKGNLRSCGGHIHLGASILKSNGPEPIMMVYMLDLLLGVPSLFLDQDPTSARRKRLYGQAGRYRPRPFGIEYRTLGNFWLQSPRLVGLVYNLCKTALQIVKNGKAAEMWSFDRNVFYNSDDLSLAWKCQAYDAKMLKLGIDSGNKTLIQSHFELAKSLLASELAEELEICINHQWGDFYSEWDL